MGSAVDIAGVKLGPGHRLVLIAGPCVIESPALVLGCAERLVELCGPLGLPLIFKCSFEKDNRSQPGAYRGPGLAVGLPVLAEVRRRYAVPVLSDVHRACDVLPAAEVLDILQVPAFLSRQTSLLEAVSAAGRPVNLKKGQFLSPAKAVAAVQKLTQMGASDVLLTERGSCFGYDRLVVDFGALAELRTADCPIVVDAGHPARSAAEVPLLARCGAAAGADALFLECHPDPATARCDGDRMLSLAQLGKILPQIVQLAVAARGAGSGAKQADLGH